MPVDESNLEQQPIDFDMRLDILKRGLSPLGLQTAAMLLLSDIARRAESAPHPVAGSSVIQNIASAACEHYRTIDQSRTEP